MKSRNILTRLAGGLTLLASAVGLATADVVTEPERTIGLGYAAQAFFVPDGRHIATITEGGAVLWDKESAAVVRGVGVWRGEQLQAFSPDGKFLLGAPGYSSGPESPILWDVGTGQALRSLVGHLGGVRAIAFSADGSRILTGSTDGTARLWDTTSGGSLQTFERHATTISHVAFAPDGSRILTASEEEPTAKLWAAATGGLFD